MTRDDLITRIMARIESDGAIHRSSLEQEIAAWEALNRQGDLLALLVANKRLQSASCLERGYWAERMDRVTK